MTRYIGWGMSLMLIVGLSGCNKNNPQLHENSNSHNPSCKQELSKSTDWVASWRTCDGDGAIKKDGTLWQFGKVGGCDGSQMYPMDVKKTYTYHLKGKKIGDGFDRAKIINKGDLVYAIKKDGTLWGWGEEFSEKPKLLSKSKNWVDFGFRQMGQDCYGVDIGLMKDGSLWVLEGFDYVHKRFSPHFKRVGTQKGWDKVLLDCYTTYAMKKDGSLWVRNRSKGFKFVKFDSKIHCNRINSSFCKKRKSIFSKMPSQTIYSFYDEMKRQKVNVGSSTGTLCLNPEIKYSF